MPRASVSNVRARGNLQGVLDDMPSKSSPSHRGAGALRGVAAMYPRGEAVTRLKGLFQTLSTTAHGDGEKYESQVKAAANEAFVGHPESDVRLWTARCLVEALRIYAPNQPFEDAALLRRVLLLILEQIGILREPSSPMFDDALDILQKLVDFGGLMLIFDCANESELLVTLVNRCVGAAHATRNNDNSHLHTLLIQVLGRTLAEADNIPQSALVTLAEELIPERRCIRGRELAVRVLRILAQGSAALSINEFLNASLYVDGMSEAHEDEELRGRILEIAVELFRIDSALTARVIPNLQMDLESVEVHRRQGATRCVGQMLAHYAVGTTTGLPLMGTSPRLLDKFLDRFNDAEEVVRKLAIDGAAEILATVAAVDERDLAIAVLSDAARRIQIELKERCLDPSEEVRVRVVQVVAETSSSVRGFHYLETLVPVAFQRLLDKKPRVREICIEACALVYGKLALPAWIEGRQEQALQFAFIPQVLFEAYSVFAGSRLGHTIQIEKHIEHAFLGFGADAAQRGRALAGLLASVVGHSAAEKGLYQLLDKKREGHASLWRFLSMRLAKGAKSAPVLTRGGVAACFAANSVAAIEDDKDKVEELAESAESIRNNALLALGTMERVSPLVEDKNNLTDHSEDFRNLDLVRDREFWISLYRLTDPTGDLQTPDLENQFTKLKDLTDRAKNISTLWPLLRRCLLASWLVPDQVSSLLTVWRTSLADDCQMALVVQRAMSVLPRYFPGAFLPHVATIAEHLIDPSTKSVDAALVALAAIGKRRYAVSPTPLADAAGLGDPIIFAEKLLKAVESLCLEDDASRCQGSVCRKAVRALSIMEPDQAWSALEKFMAWAEWRPTGSPIALRLIAASRDWLLHMPECPEKLQSRALAREWLIRACRVLQEPLTPANASMQYAASELLAAAGDETELVALIDRKASDSALFMTPRSSEDVQLLHPERMLLQHACIATLRGIRRGSLQLTTGLLKCIAAQASLVFAPERNPEEIETLLKELQQLQKPSSSLSLVLPLKLTARLRLCVTLPTLFAKAASKNHRDVALRIVQTSLAKAIRQSTERQLPMLDFAVACFVHFLSRVPAFVEEANMALTAFVESSRISAFFVEALLRVDPSKSADLATTVLKVTGRVNQFVDREAPNSDRIHKAAYVLKHVMEKRCPELGKLDVKLQGGGLPAELFSVPPPRVFTEPSQIADTKQELPPRENRILSLERQSRKNISSGSRPALAESHGRPSAGPAQQPASMTKTSTPLRPLSSVPPCGQQDLCAKASKTGGASSVAQSGPKETPMGSEAESRVSVAPASSDLPATSPTPSNVLEDATNYSEVKPRRLSFPTAGKEHHVMSALRGSDARHGKRDNLDSHIERTTDSKKPRTADNRPSPGPWQ